MILAAQTGRSASWLRKALDFAGACLCLLLTAPLMAGAALAIWLTDGSPVFFRQERIGQNGRPFLLWKFRSMRLNNLPMDNVTEIRPGHPLVTPVGAWLRRYKVDELPQLFNVIAGEMALVGPRPTIREQVENYSEFQMRRLAIPPGMTGWSQVNGGIDIPWSDRILLDVWYVDHQSYWLDVIILARTLGVVFGGEETDSAALRQAEDHAMQQAGFAELHLSGTNGG